MSMMVSFFPRGVLDEILNLIESVSEGCPSYSCSSLPSLNVKHIYENLSSNKTPNALVKLIHIKMCILAFTK